MADEEQVKRLKEKGVSLWNEWLRKNPETQVDLSGASLRFAYLRAVDFRKADLSGADFYEVDFVGADLRGAKLRRANLSGAILSEADLGGTDLSEADLSRTNLSETSLSDADLSGANLSNALLSETNLHGANLKEAAAYGTMFINIDLRHVKGLETIEHRGPSKISISTIYLSQGEIPFEFLRGAGVPDPFIEYMHSLVGTAFEFYSCFISYSSKDQPFAERLHADLQANGVRCWFAPHHAQAGQKLNEQIDQAIRLHEKLLLILSTDSIKSEWVKTEIKKAAKRQKQEKKDVLFPVLLVPFDDLREWECWDGDLGKDLGAEIREYLIPDFSGWKDHDSYQKALAKLLRDLRSGKTKTV